MALTLTTSAPPADPDGGDVDATTSYLEKISDGMRAPFTGQGGAPGARDIFSLPPAAQILRQSGSSSRLFPGGPVPWITTGTPGPSVRTRVPNRGASPAWPSDIAVPLPNPISDHKDQSDVVVPLPNHPAHHIGQSDPVVLLRNDGSSPDPQAGAPPAASQRLPGWPEISAEDFPADPSLTPEQQSLHEINLNAARLRSRTAMHQLQQDDLADTQRNDDASLARLQNGVTGPESRDALDRHAFNQTDLAVRQFAGGHHPPRAPAGPGNAGRPRPGPQPGLCCAAK